MRLTDDELRARIAANRELPDDHPMRNDVSMAMAEELLAWRATHDMVAMVREFHLMTGQRDAMSPDLSDYRVNDLRIKLIDEERGELLQALAAENIVEVADALADLLYVTIGSALQWGIPIRRVFAEVHRSNMTKSGKKTRPDGKILKGNNYSPPDIGQILASCNGQHVKEEP